MTNSGTTTSQQRRSRIALTGMITLGLLLRLWHLGTQSLSMDEVTDSGIASRAIRSVILTQDGFPPLYSLVAHMWLGISSDPASLRILSVVFGTISILVVWHLGRLAGGELVAGLAAFLLAVSPLHISFSQEARAYALYFLLAALGIWLFYKARIVDTSRNWAAYVTVATLGFYTHYYYAVLMLGLCLTIVLEGKYWPRARGLLWAHLAVVALATPGLFLLRGDLGLQQGYTLVRPDIGLTTIGYAGFTFLAGFGIGPSSRELHILDGSEAMREFLPWILVLGASLSYLLLKAVTSPARSPVTWRHLAVLIALPVVLCVLLGAVLGIGFRIRYVVWCGAPLAVLLALGAAQKPRSWGTLLAMAVLVVVSVLSTINRSTVGRYMNEDLRGAASFLISTTDSTTPVFVLAGYMAGVLRYYAGERIKAFPLKGMDGSADSTTAMQQLRRVLSPGQRFWLVYTRPFDGDSHGRLLRLLQDRAALRLRAELPGVTIHEARGF